MWPESQRRQRTTWWPHKAQLNRRAAFLIATDENGVDPRPDAHDTAHTGRALHGSGGAAPVVAIRQTGPAPHRSQQPQSTPLPQPGNARRCRQRNASLQEAKISARRGPGTPVGLRPPSVPGPRRKPGRACLTPVVPPHQNARFQQITAVFGRHLQAVSATSSSIAPEARARRSARSRRRAER